MELGNIREHYVDAEFRAASIGGIIGVVRDLPGIIFLAPSRNFLKSAFFLQIPRWSLWGVPASDPDSSAAHGDAPASRSRPTTPPQLGEPSICVG